MSEVEKLEKKRVAQAKYQRSAKGKQKMQAWRRKMY